MGGLSPRSLDLWAAQPLADADGASGAFLRACGFPGFSHNDWASDPPHSSRPLCSKLCRKGDRIMGMKSFIGKVLRRTFTSPFEKADAIAGILGAIGGIIAFWKPNMAAFLGLLSGAAFFGILFGVLIYRLLFSPYWIYRDEVVARADAEKKLDAYKKSLPRILVDQIREAPMHVQSQIQESRRRIFRVIQIWFKNEPEFPSSESVAENVSALIEYCHEGEDEKLFQVHGQWALSTAPDHVGYSGITPALDLPPGSLYGKLFIALKYESDEEAYAFSQESLGRSGDGRDPSVRLDKGRYRIHITLEGVRVRSDYWLTLINPGVGENLQIEATTQAGSLRSKPAA